MKVNANTLKPGNVIEHNGKLFSIIKGEISQPGKGGAFVNMTMRDIKNGNKDVQRFRTQEGIEKVRLEQDDYQYLYPEGDQFTFMHLGTYEQINIDADLIGEPAKFLQDGMTVVVESYDEKPLSVKLPDTVIGLIVEAEPVVKGQTATTSFKPAILDNGVRVMVPPHIGTEVRIVVRTEDSSYVEKAKD
ncbi:MAG: elongation factor P [Alphaproteobacteria bacterium]|nr:elongation factor P [Alphaproteobacteria bacterium]